MRGQAESESRSWAGEKTSEDGGHRDRYFNKSSALSAEAIVGKARV